MNILDNRERFTELYKQQFKAVYCPIRRKATYLILFVKVSTDHLLCFCIDLHRSLQVLFSWPSWIKPLDLAPQLLLEKPKNKQGKSMFRLLSLDSDSPNQPNFVRCWKLSWANPG